MPDTLSDKFQFINYIFRIAHFIDAPKYITNIHTNGPVKVFIKLYLMAECFIISVESKADKIAITIHNWRARIAAGDVVCCDKINYKIVAFFINVLTKVTLL